MLCLVLISFLYNGVLETQAAMVRSSDPAVSMDFMPEVFDFPLGNPEVMKNDVIGESLNPNDFQSQPQQDDPVDLVDENDPIFLAGLYQGDIMLMSQDDVAMINGYGPLARSAITKATEKWQNAVIPYLISSSYNKAERGTIARAIAVIEDTTCIRLVPRQSERDYVHILRASGCSSAVGRQGGSQALSLASGCMYAGVIMHEITHALGFWHEHSRPDRDNYIYINNSNIQNGMDYNFKKLDFFGPEYLKVGYDLGSIMHYGKNAFAKNRQQSTIIPRYKAQIGQRRMLSPNDIAKINMLYNCDTGGPGSKPKPGSKPTGSKPAGGGGSCTDLEPSCGAWADKGECDSNPRYMLSYCCKSCKSGGGGTKPVKPVTPSKCRDDHRDCATWAQSGECRKNPAYMTTTCKESCGACDVGPGPSPTSCTDKNQYCEDWTFDNQCIVNPTYMHRYCEKSCGLC